MQFGVSTWLWQSGLDAEDPRRLAPEVARMGFDLIEIPIDEPDQMDWGEAAAICDELELELIDRVDHPACRLILDLFHMGIEEKSMGDAIRSAGPHLRHLHVSENDRGTPGTGQFPWEEIAEALVEVGYDGPVVIETFSEQNETLARAASIWRPLAESPEAMAEDGLRFLRGLLVD